MTFIMANPEDRNSPNSEFYDQLSSIQLLDLPLMAGYEKVVMPSLESISNTSSCVSNNDTAMVYELAAPEISSFKKLSENLDSLFQLSEFQLYSDARIVVSGGQDVRIHRCILAARSPFFKQLFSAGKDKHKYELKEIASEFNVGYHALVAVLEYIYSGQVKLPPAGICICVDEGCPHQACRPVIDFAVEVLYLSYVFQIVDLIDFWKNKILNILDSVEKDDILNILPIANLCDKEDRRLLNKCIENVVISDIDVIALEKALPPEITKEVIDARVRLNIDPPGVDLTPSKHVRRIYRALDSDDVELVRLLLREGHTSLDEAEAIHYAVAYCDSRTAAELLELGLGDINHMSIRGYTLLHVAARRKEPNILISLVTKGARATDLTADGRKALQIAKRLTKAVDYNKPLEEGKSSPKDKLCIDILIQAEMREPLLGEACASLSNAGDDLRLKLLYLENRVGLAKLLFPAEATVAMEIAHVEVAQAFSLSCLAKASTGQQMQTMDLNETPFTIKEEHLKRYKALSRTVELGKRFFPRCSAVLNRIMDNDELSELAELEEGTSIEQCAKRRRYMELQDLVKKAFTEDKEELDKSTISSSSSSSSPGERARYRMARR